MIDRLFLPCTFFLLSLQITFAQQVKLEFGGQIAFASNFVKVSDSGNRTKQPGFNPSTALLGFYAKVNSNKWGGFKVGLLRHNWSRMICMENLGCLQSRSPSPDLELEILYTKKFYLKNSKWTFSPYLGYGLGVRRSGVNMWVPYQNGINPPTNSSPYLEGEENRRLRDFYHLINVEIESSYMLSNHINFNLYVKYGQGLEVIAEDRFSYRYEDGSIGDASFTQNGGYWSLGLRLSYLLALKNNTRA